MKRFAVAVLAVLFVLSLTVSAMAAPPGPEAAKIREEDGKPGKDKALGLTVDGEERPWGDVPPVIKEGRVLIPIRGMMAALGAKVDWNAEDKMVTIELNDSILEIDFGALDENGMPAFYFNDVKIDGPDVPPKSINGRIVLPLRFIAEVFGLTVDFDAERNQVRLADRNKPAWADRSKPDRAGQGKPDWAGQGKPSRAGNDKNKEEE